MAAVSVTVHIKTPLTLRIVHRFCWLMAVLSIWTDNAAKYAAASFTVWLICFRIGSGKWRRLRR